MTRLAAAFRWLVRWFEDGDLVPLLVIVSAAHYIAILSAVDPWFVAVPLGILVDLGHYRAVIIAARYSGDNWRQRAVRWAVAIGLTVISGAYHLRYYGGDWALALPIPALIVALAYFRRMAPVAPHKAESPPQGEKALREDTASGEVLPQEQPGNGNGNGAGKEAAYREWLHNRRLRLVAIAAIGGCSTSTASRWRAEWEEAQVAVTEA